MDNNEDNRMDSEKIIITESPVTDQETNINNKEISISFQDYVEKIKEKYILKDYSEEDWLIHRQFIVIGGRLGLSQDEISIYADPKFNIKQKEVLLFLLFADFINVDVIMNEFANSDIAAETMLVKLNMILNQEINDENRRSLDNALEVYKDAEERLNVEKEHLKEAYDTLNKMFQRSEAEVSGLRAELDMQKKDSEKLLQEINDLKESIVSKEKIINDLNNGNIALERERLEKEDKEAKDKELNDLIEERAEERFQQKIQEDEEKRREREIIEQEAIKKYKQEHGISENINDINQIIKVKKNNKDQKSGVLSKIFKKKNESSFYGMDLTSCIVNANLNKAQTDLITYAIEHGVSEALLVTAINNDLPAEKLKALIEAQLAQRMLDNKRKEQEEKNLHQQNVNNYGTYTAEDTRYGD